MRIPYPGLRAFTRDEADLFFGRDRCADAMVDILARQRFLSVLGSSGSGKSSLVRTGLLEALALGFHVKAGPDWRTIEARPGDRPITALAERLLESFEGSPPSTEAVSLLRAFLLRGPRSLAEWLAGRARPERENILILVDQFEELFRYGGYAARDEAEAFSALLLESTEAVPRLAVAITMRSEFVGACALIPGLAERISGSMYLTPRMTRDEIREAILGPARALEFTIEPALVDRLLNDLSSFAPWEGEAGLDQTALLSRRADQLPLMQHVLNRLWAEAAGSAAPGQAVLTLAAYERLGRLNGALDLHAAEVLQSLDMPVRVVGAVFRGLVDGASIATAVRRPLPLGTLITESGADAAAVRAVVEAFRAADVNFLQPAPPAPLRDDTIIDISHESLIRQWPRLSAWLAEENHSQEKWRQLIAAESEWRSGQGDFLASNTLVAILDWWHAEEPNPTWARRHGGGYEGARDFLKASRAAEEARSLAARRSRNTRQRLLYGTALILLCAVVTTTIAWLDAREQRVVATRQTAVANEQTVVANEATDRANEAFDGGAFAVRSFVGDLVERVRDTPRVPPAEIAALVQRADAFLADFARRAGNSDRALRTAVEIGLKLAEAELEEGNLADARARLETAGGRLAGAAAPATDTLATRLMLLEAELALQSDTPAEALRLALAARASLGDGARDPDARRLLATAAQLAARSHLEANRPAAALPEAEGCLPLLAPLPPAEAGTAEAAAECLRLAARARAALGDHSAALAAFIEARGRLDAIPVAERRRGTRFLLGRLLRGIGEQHLDGTPSDLPSAQAALAAAGEVLAQLIDDFPSRTAYRAQYTAVLIRQGNAAFDRRDYTAAARHYGEAVALDRHVVNLPTASAAQLEDHVDLLDRFANTLARQQVDQGSPSGFAARVDVGRSLLAAQEALARRAPDRARPLAAFGTLRWLVHEEQQRVKSSREGGAESWLGWFDRFAAICRGEQDPVFTHDSVRDTPQFRRDCFWAHYSLPSGPEDIPYVAAAEDRVALLSEAAERLEAYHAAHGQPWFIAMRLGSLQAGLARLHLGSDNAAALRAAERSAALENSRGIALLASWYETGAGPVIADQERAAELRSRLGARGWGLRSFTIQADDLATPDEAWTRQTIYLEEPLHAQDDPGERMLHQLESLEGYRAAPDAVAAMRDALAQARSGGTNFLDEVARRLGGSTMPDAAREVPALLDRIAQGGRVTLAANLASALRSMDRGGSMAAAIAEHVAAQGATISIAEISQVTAGLVQGRQALLARALLNNLMRLPRWSTVEYGSLLLFSAFVHDDQGETQHAQADRMLVAALLPNYASNLNNLAYEWVESESHLSAAVALLERAHHAEPQDPLIMDSYGWALVKAGRLERGVVLLEESLERLATYPRRTAYYEAANRAHLGEGYRRLGRTAEALEQFEAALRLQPDARVAGLVRRSQSLLLVGVANADEHAPYRRLMAATATGFTRSPRISSDRIGLAIRGYDPVAYHRDGRARPGSAGHFAIHAGAIWLFTSAENAANFDADPDRYVPQFGGHCAGCLGGGNKVHSDPEFWIVVDGRLYLHSSAELRDSWRNQTEDGLRRTREHWERHRDDDIANAADTVTTRRLASQRGASEPTQTEEDARRRLLDSAAAAQADSAAAYTQIAETMRAAGFVRSPRISTDQAGIAIGGYDPVAFIRESLARPGRAQHFALHAGAVWLFASADHAELFRADPDRYIPQFGGYCAGCLAGGNKTHADPEFWVIVEGRLYLHSSAGLRDQWRGQPERLVTDARATWGRLQDEPSREQAANLHTRRLSGALRR